MSDLQIIRTTVASAAKRRRWLRGWRGFWQGLLVGASLWLVALGCYKVFPIPFEIVIGTGVVGVLCLLAGFLHGWLRPMSLIETARWIDEQQKLQERLSTALEMADSHRGNWKDLLISDAAKHAGELNFRTLLPAHLPKASCWALLVLALGAGLGFIPEYRSKNFVQKQNETAVIKEAGKQISQLTRRELVQRPPALEKTKESLESIEELGNQLSKNAAHPHRRAERISQRRRQIKK